MTSQHVPDVREFSVGLGWSHGLRNLERGGLIVIRDK